MYTILHLSDLHRSSHEPVTNETLIASLLSDRDHYVTETPAVPSPDAIVVSGDLIQGALVAAPGWQSEMGSQYEVAYQFLTTLADRMLGGDRTKMVLIPGNHDVCWNTARSAMRQLDPTDEPPGIPDVLFHPTSKLRWCWKERAMFRIENDDTYRQRLNAYWDFVERFYAGTQLPYPLVRERGFNLFELANGKIVVAAFDSLHGNDCFCYQGAIEDGVVARSSIALRDANKPHLLRLAVWHHGVHGPPARTDYMDVHTVYEMIGNGFRLGLHGHQHLADAGAHYINLPEQQSMAVISAGSLCAGSRELPRGINRQYNIVVLDDNFLNARVHVREMHEGHQFGRCTRGRLAASGLIELEWQHPTDAFGRPIDPVVVHEREVVLRAETMLRSGNAEAALRLLQEIDTAPGTFARSLRVEAARATGQWAHVSALLAIPTSADELVALIEAHIAQHQAIPASEALLRHASGLKLPRHIHDELKGRIGILAVLLK